MFYVVDQTQPESWHEVLARSSLASWPNDVLTAPSAPVALQGAKPSWVTTAHRAVLMYAEAMWIKVSL